MDDKQTQIEQLEAKSKRIHRELAALQQQLDAATAPGARRAAQDLLDAAERRAILDPCPDADQAVAAARAALPDLADLKRLIALHKDAVEPVDLEIHNLKKALRFAEDDRALARLQERRAEHDCAPIAELARALAVELFATAALRAHVENPLYLDGPEHHFLAAVGLGGDARRALWPDVAKLRAELLAESEQ